MKTAMRKGASRVIATLLSVVMLTGLLPAGAMASAASGGQTGEEFARIVHLDIGRKYFSPETIMSIIDEMAALGYNQLELDFGNSGEGQIRFKLDNMEVSYTYYTEGDAQVVPPEELPVNELPTEPAAPEETAPVEPTEPAAPEETAPVEPTEPVAPEETAPVEPTEPVTPEETAPVEPTEPAAPEESAPVEPTEPAAPEESAPVEPTEPAAPEESAPVEPTEPAAPEETAPAESAGPETPAEGGTDGGLLDGALGGVTAQTVGSASSGVMVIDVEQVEHTMTVDLAPVFPEGEYLTEENMASILSYAQDMGIQVVPLLNTPGHMGAILGNDQVTLVTTDENGKPVEVDYTYEDTKSLDITSDAARAFGVALVKKYASWFADHGCTIFNIGADEFANDTYTTGGMGFGKLVENGHYEYFAQYVTELYDMLTEELRYTTVRAFNDGICYNESTDYTFPDLEICYWSNGWSGYEVASARFLYQNGFDLINTHGDYYYILGKSSIADKDPSAAAAFEPDQFMGESDPITAGGAMFCVWCDDPDAKDEAEILEEVPEYLKYFAANLGGGEAVDEATGITVTAPGVSSVTVTADPDVSGVAALRDGQFQDYVAYDVTVNGGMYTGEAQVTLPVPTDWADAEASQLQGWVVDAGTQELEPGTGGTLNAGGTYTFTAPHFSTVVLTLSEARTTLGPVNLAEKESTELQAPGDLSGETVTFAPDNGVAQVEVRYVPGESSTTLVPEETPDGEYVISDNNGHYLTLSGSGLANTSDVDAATRWTVTPSGNEYTISSGGRSLYASWSSWGGSYSLSASTRNETTWSYDGNGFYVTRDGWFGSTDYYLRYASSYGGRGSWGVTEGTSGRGSAYTVQTNTEEGHSVITVYGEQIGETTAIIGNYQIPITVTPNLNAPALEIEYWITNGRAHDGAESNKSATVTAESVYPYGENGVAVEGLVAENTIKDGTSRELKFWKTNLLDTTLRNDSTSGTEEQVEVAGDDETWSGNQFTRVRFWKGAWEVSTTDGQWLPVEEKHQLVAYYMEQVNIANELEILSADWGKRGDGSSGGDYTDTARPTTISVQIVYEDSSTNPEDITAEALRSKTIVFNNWSGGRGIGTWVFNQTADPAYEIIEVTSTTGRSTVSFPGGNYGSATMTSVDWYDNETTVWDDGPASSVVLYNNAREPDGTYPNNMLMWTATTGDNFKNRDNAILIRVYVRAVPTEDSLYVHYMDGTPDSAVQFYQYPITVNEGTLFDKTFGLIEGSENLTGNMVINVNDQPQYVTTDLSRLTEISAEYRGTEYTCTHAVRGEDGKHVYLYYTFNEKDSYKFVADYGLPLTISASDIGLSPDMTWATAEVTDGSYGTAEASVASVVNSALLTYTPNTIFGGRDRIVLTLTDSTGDEMTRTIFIYPASTVYYEAEQSGFLDYSGNWSGDGQPPIGVQETSLLGSSSVYGSDSNYDSQNGAADSRNGSAQVKVNKGDTTAPTASFTFTGRAVDIIARTDRNSGIIIAEIQGDGYHRYYLVNNYYTAADPVNGLYQIPVLRVAAGDGEPWGTYDVTIHVLPFYTAAEGKMEGTDKLAGAGQNTGSSTFYLDAIRVYETLRPGSEQALEYAQDGEANPSFYEVGAYTTVGENGVWIDSNGEANQSEYENPGPNNEVYLADGQSITVGLSGIYSDGQNLFLAARSMENGSSVRLNVGSGTIDVDGGSDQYYDITGLVNGDALTIENNSGTRIALTTLKVTDEAGTADGN